MRYAVVIEQAGAGFSAYAPDLPGCIASGSSVDAVEGLMIPRPVSKVEYMEMAA
jgi:predicted RNase H-like HicB family nuclease